MNIGTLLVQLTRTAFRCVAGIVGRAVVPGRTREDITRNGQRYEAIIDVAGRCPCQPAGAP